MPATQISRMANDMNKDYSTIPGTPTVIGTPGTPERTSMEITQTQDYFALPLAPPLLDHKRNSSILSLSTIVGEKKDFNLQKVDPDFTDSRGEYFKSFEKSLEKWVLSFPLMLLPYTDILQGSVEATPKIHFALNCS
jgi:hypothetical protein